MATYMFEQFVFEGSDTIIWGTLRELKGINVSVPIRSYPFKCGRIYQFIIKCDKKIFDEVLKIFVEDEIFFTYREVFP